MVLPTIGALSALLSLPAAAQQFNCSEGGFYQVYGAGNTGTFAQVDRTRTPYALTTRYVTTPLPLNSLAYNPVDNYLYALRSSVTVDAPAVYRLGSSAIVPLNGAEPGAVVSGLPALTLNAGEMDEQGNWFVTPNLTNNRIYRITGVTGATPTPVAVLVPVSSDPAPPAGFSGGTLVSPGDFSLNRAESSAALTVLYGVAGTTLYRVAIDGPGGASPVARVSSRATTLPASPSVGATYFDAPATLYAYGNSVGFYTIDIGTGLATKVSDAATTARSDGARCPAAPPAEPPTLVLDKVTDGSADGPFTFSVSNAGQPTGTVTTTTAGVPAQVDGDTGNAGLQPFVISAFGNDVVIAETDTPAGWSLADASCTAGGVPVGARGTGAAASTYTIPGQAVQSGVAFACTFRNRRQSADLSITKTNAGASLAVGATTTYTIVAANAGPDGADGALLRDTPTSGLDCSAGPANCTATGGAQCPGGAVNGPAVAVPVASLLAGVAIPTFPASGSVSVTLACVVTAPAPVVP